MAEYETPVAAPSDDGTKHKKLSAKELTKWKTLVRIAEQYQKRKGNLVSGNNTEGRWDTNIKALDGDFNSLAELGQEAVDVNLSHTTVQTLLSPLWTTVPYITIQPTMAKYQDGDQEVDNILRARLTEYEINYWMRELEVNHVNKKCVLDNAATNAGYAYLGYIAAKEDFENDEGEETENEPQVRLKQPFVKRICPRNVLIPPGYYDIEEAPWIALLWPKPVCDVRDRYDVPDLPADMTGWSEDEMKALALTSEMTEYLKGDDAGVALVWQVWSKRDKKLITFTMAHDEALECEDWPYDLEGFPLVKQRFTWTPDQQFGMPMMSAWLPQQKELNAARSATRSRESRTKTGVFVLNAPEGMIDQYKKAEDGFVIDLKADTDDIRKLIQLDNGLPPAISAYNYGEISKNDMFLASGLGSNQRSQGDPNSGSATESALIDKWAQIRQTDMGDTVRTFYLAIAKKIWMLLKTFPNVKRDMLVTGPQGTLQRVTYTLAELKGEFAFSMDLSAMYTEDPVTRQRNAMARYNLLRADPLVRGDKLVADLLASGNIYNLESYMTALMSPNEEFQRMLQGLPVVANELDDHVGHMTEHDKQADQLEQLIKTSPPGSPEEVKGRTALNLLIAHVNDTMRLVGELDSKNKKPGEPVAENTLRADTAQAPSGETAAELSGQPQGTAAPETSPAGIGGA